jgi:hypothetical protein
MASSFKHKIVASDKQKHNTPSYFEFALVRIDVLKNLVNTPSHFDVKNTDLKYGFEAEINAFRDKSILQVVINYEFSTNREILQKMQVASEFEVRNFTILTKDSNAKENFLYFLIKLSINHSRGIQAIILKDTPLENLFIPFIPDQKIKKSSKISLP